MKLHLAALCLSALPLLASQETLQLDPSNTEVDFTLGSVLHTVHGSFRLDHGRISFDPKTGSASGEVVLDATSAKTGSDARDSRMHKQILESGRYPLIIFRPDRVEGQLAGSGKSQVQLHGIFTLHGADHEMKVPLDIDAADGRYTTTAHFQVPYQKWGLKNPSTFVLRVSDQVDITVHTVARPSQDAGPHNASGQ